MIQKIGSLLEIIECVIKAGIMLGIRIMTALAESLLSRGGWEVQQYKHLLEV